MIDDIYGIHKFLDNCIEEANLPHQFLTDELLLKRKRGMGFTGLADMFVMMGTRYGSVYSQELAREISYNMAKHTLIANVRLAKERGPAPICLVKTSAVVTSENVDKDFIEQFIGSDYYTELFFYAGKIDDNDWIREAKEDIFKYGIRFTHGLAIAPTGTMSAVNNNMSSGIEPIFDLKGQRNVIVDDKSTKQLFDTYDHAYTQYVIKHYVDGGIHTEDDLPDNFEEKIRAFPLKSIAPERLLNAFVVTNDLNVEDHLNIMGAVAPFMDQAISKTINLPAETTYEEYKGVWFKAWEMGIKGVTIYRPDPSMIAQVLVDQEVMAKTVYEFTLEDGSIVPLKGNQNVQYKGEIHNVANLADAIQQGKYGINMISEELLTNEK